MLLRVLLMFCICTVFHSNLFAQNVMHSLGVNLSVIFGEIKTSNLQESFAMQVNHFSWFPRYNLMEAENSSLSLGSPIGAGVNLLTDNAGSGGVSWGFEIPIVLDYNIGCKSTPDNESGFGGYFGAGFSYMHTSYKLYDEETNKLKSYGPLARAGVRFASGQGRWHTTVGLFFKKGLEKEKFNTAGFNIYMDF